MEGHDHHDHADHDHGDHGAADDCMGHSGHSMVFHAGVCQEILFSGWVTRSALELLGSAAAIFLCGVLYEGLKYYREALFARHSAAAAADSQVNIAKSECGARCSGTAVVKYSMLSSGHAAQTVLHAVQAAASYLLMLVFMTYNVWLCLALVLGLATGYFCFGWRKNTVVDVTEHCQ
ncbi:high affinity copper uptake protein 1-like [Aricia agestis]|uniref:high affinity copper uptake protein 1-like n=1 Tax=Aricia agestis TaxID=91739 RepID=UPI001C2078C1|nr:high affinity copper uptake protein 1-like [Aricia agestis]XP_041969585.1 high affinity copper uptake protein 1-like [Aricia agestis]